MGLLNKIAVSVIWLIFLPVRVLVGAFIVFVKHGIVGRVSVKVAGKGKICFGITMRKGVLPVFVSTACAYDLGNCSLSHAQFEEYLEKSIKNLIANKLQNQLFGTLTSTQITLPDDAILEMCTVCYCVGIAIPIRLNVRNMPKVFCS